MSLLPILHYPDERLRTIATPVEKVDDEIRTLVDDMFETMYQAPGIGLAATQVDVHKRLLVIDISEDKTEPLCFINPQIIADSGVEVMEVPGIYEPVTRAKEITVRALGRDGNSFDMTVNGLLAVCVQHEMDHLEGKLFVDYLSEMKRQRIRKKMQKLRQHTL